ncbi:MAG: archaellin/type IV pilin N-terminal domain-containing protein [Nanoarchaeota archaeon]
MYNNKKGLSTIVATLLIILLTLVAVGIIWVVVRNVVKGGSEQVDIDAKCLQAIVEVTNVENTTAGTLDGDFNVTLSRTSGSEIIGGVKLVFTDDANSVSDVVSVSKNIGAFVTTTESVSMNITAIPNPGKVNAVVYFLDDAGNEQLCSASQNPFAF